MELSFEQLKSMVVFAHVANKGSFSAAAKEIGLSRGVVSYHIKKLEQQLGVTLINRSTRSFSLTEAGKHYFEHCHAITQQAASAQQQIENFKHEPEGLLKISCPINLGMQLLLPALNRFKQHYPKIKLEIDFSDRVVNIVEDGIDLAIRGAKLADSSLQATKLATLETGLFAAPSYLAQHGRPTRPAQLSQHHWVIYQLAATTLELQQGERSYSMKPKGEVSTNNAAARTAFVVGGHGIGRIPLYDALPKISSGELEQLLPHYRLQAIEVYGVYVAGSAQTKKLRILLDYLKQHFAQQS
ncbi:LysR family transcriptional regulator [uncultured Ferrimonas sp.]|uniref:LysR family transcriptional regulator n=1 Tax=uncultured Ferrimonas sp. TaxID=432640 RepID=UPI00262F8F00|nr:LysR family transcriptional regulator [uncultured Ferrimonas sp.]